MSLFNNVTSLIAPYDCLGCGREAGLVCAACQAKWRPLRPRCFRCLRPSAASLTCPDCYRVSQLYRVQAVTTYASATGGQLVRSFKFQGLQAARRLMAEHMAKVLGNTDHHLLLPIPTATSRVRQRGYDHALLLTKSLSRELGLPCQTNLRRLGQQEQVGAQRQQRLLQLQQAFVVNRPAAVVGRRILLVDDVVTTGATLTAAALALKAAGASRVDAIVFARA